MNTCPACGTQNAEGSNFCIACGVDLNAAATERQLRTDSVAAPTPETPPMTSPSVDMPREYIDTTPVPPTVITRPAASYSAPASGAAPGAAPLTSAPAKDRTIALALEIGGGLVSLLGIGWLYAGNTTAGILWLAGMLIGTCIAVTLDVVTVGFFLCVHLPVWLACVGISAYLLYNYTKQHPEAFGP